MTSVLLTRLDVETRTYHADADRPWLDLLAGSLGADKYRDLLVRVYGFEAPLEAALAYTPHLPKLVDLRRRARSGLLAQDALALGMKPAQLSRVAQCMIAPFRGPAEALGWMYVVERGSFLHRAVRTQLVDRLPDAAEASSYLGFSASLGPRWTELGAILDAVARTPSIEHQIICSARDAFRCARDWFDTEMIEARGA